MAPSVCVVTGAATGIGLAIAERFLRGDWAVAGLDIDGARLREAATELTSVGHFEPVIGDVANIADLERAADAAERTGALRCWVNNAAVNFMGTVATTDPAVYDRGVAVNLGGVFWGTAVAVRRMLSARAGGCVLNISSVQSLMGIKGFAGYAACKGAINALSRQVAAEYAAMGIRCNAIAPGVIVTEMHHRLLQEHPEPETVRSFHRALCPIGRLGRPDDVAEAAFFLGREDTAGFITGQLLQVDGGATVVAPGQ